MKKQAFTLVELIVVITILAILATIGFVSFSGYLAGTRDTNRIAQLKSMSDALELYRTKKDLPIPDDKIDIKAGATTIAYQGYIGENVLETIEYTEKGLDPKDKTYFSYYLTKNKKYFQLLSFLEEPSTDVLANNTNRNLTNNNLLNTTQAVDYSARVPHVKGKKLGILTDENNTPIQELSTIIGSGSIDIYNLGVTNYKSIISDDEIISGNGTELISSNPIANCKRIKQINGGSADGFYTIDPSGDSVGFEVYCYMKNPKVNLLKDNWTLGSGSNGLFIIGGASLENERINGTTPFGDTDVIWKAIPDGGGGYDGGWNHNNNIPVDHTKTYRSSVWIKKTGNTNGTTYLGCHNVSSLAGVNNGNPYFFAGELPSFDKWYLIVGYIHGSSYTGTTYFGGVYDGNTGEKVANTTDFKNNIDTVVSSHRSFLYGNTNDTNRQYFYAPRFEEIDESDVGNIDDLLRL